VFAVNHTVEKATLWWSGNDTIRQTHYGWKNVYFNDNVADPDNALLFNGKLTLSVKIVGSPPRFEVTSTMGDSASTARFLRINNEEPLFYADTAYVIYNGIVRDIIQQEPEWDYDDGELYFPNMYSQIVLTFPANASYYTYALRTIFVDSSEVDEDRILNDLSALQLTVNPGGFGAGEIITEDGVNATGFPTPSYLEDTFNSTNWEHHWSEFLKANIGGGVMFTNSSNSQLYTFDSIAETETGALVVEKKSSNTIGYIEVNPAHLAPAEFDHPKDVTWYGAVVTFSGEPIYPTSGDKGLWVMVEHPPSVAVN